MMYGYGDAKTPDPESVALVSKLVRSHSFNNFCMVDVYALNTLRMICSTAEDSIN